MHFNIFTLFPEMFGCYFGASILERVQAMGLVELVVHDIRDFAHDRHRVTDEPPYGGGGGMVLKPEPIFRAVEAVTGAGSRTRNPAFGGRIRNMGRHTELFGYGKASLAAGLLAIARVEFFGEPVPSLAGSYPDAASQRSVTMIIEAATRVAELNYAHFQECGAAPVTAALTDDTITILDPFGPAAGTVLYQRD